MEPPAGQDVATTDKSNVSGVNPDKSNAATSQTYYPPMSSTGKACGSSGKPAHRSQLQIKRDIFKPLLDKCRWDHSTSKWVTPLTGPYDRLKDMDWANMLNVQLDQGFTPTSFVPTFFEDEPDHNQKNKPRLDIVVSFYNWDSVRYYPDAKSIWSTTPQPTDAMQQRYNKAKRLEKERRKKQHELQNKHARAGECM